VWDAQTGEEILTVTLKGGGGVVILSPDGKLLASGSDLGKTVKVWDARTGQELFSIPGAGSAYGAAFSPDSKRLATRSGD
jgi:WD40 repeat protein